MVSVYGVSAAAQQRRVRRVSISPGLLLEWWKAMREPSTFSVDGLPEDTRVVSSCYDPDHDLFTMVIASDSFPEVPTGSVLQEITLSFGRHFEQVAMH
jgi:hypothetical protein